MPEQVQEQETLHLESHVRIDDDSQTVEDARPRRFEVPVLDREAVLDDAGRDRDPEVDHVVRPHVPDSCADDLVTEQFFHRTSPVEVSHPTEGRDAQASAVPCYEWR